MLFNLLPAFAEDFQFFNLFRYLTFRAAGAVVTALVLSFIFGPWLIRWLRSRRSALPLAHALMRRRALLQ